MSLCGPTNALNKLSQHSQVDRSLHQDQQRRFAPSGVDAFKSTQQNHQLELEFQQQQQQHFQQSFNPIFANAFNKPLQRAQPQQAASSSSSWASDFTANQMNHQPQQHQYSHGWNNQFQSFQAQHQSQAPAPSIATPRSFTNLAQLSNLSMTQASFNQASTPFRTEHQELHHNNGDLLANELESEFAKLEQEFQNTSLKEEAPVFKRSNSDFANAAMQVVDAMNTNNSDKFKQSKFLSLMNMVAQGKVELNEDETKLVDEAGQDISESTNPLPDPLAGVADGSLETPFQSAQMVGDNHHEVYTWDDVYDDYRHDDSSF